MLAKRGGLCSPFVEIMLTQIGSPWVQVSVNRSSVSAAVWTVFGGFGEVKVLGMARLWEEEKPMGKDGVLQ